MTVSRCGSDARPSGEGAGGRYLPTLQPALHKRIVVRRPQFTWLTPPAQPGLMTVADVLTAEDADQHCRLVGQWGRQVWQAWAPHHATIHAWNARTLGSPS